MKDAEVVIGVSSCESWLYSQQEVQRFFEKKKKKQEVIGTFCFFFALDVLNFSGHLLSLYCFASLVCV